MNRILLLVLQLSLWVGCTHTSEPLEELKNANQIGDNWSRFHPPYSHEAITQNLTSEGQKIVSSVGRLFGTWIYLGRHKGEHIVATNEHVVQVLKKKQQQSRRPLSEYSITFSDSINNHQLAIGEVIGLWPEIDFALMTAKMVSPESQEFFAKNQAQIHEAHEIKKGTPLFIVGFGTKNNPNIEKTIALDGECRVFSNDGEYKSIRVQKALSPYATAVRAFAHGCDVSPGDSGSPIIHRETQKIIGVVKSSSYAFPNYRTSGFMTELFQNPNEGIWQYMSYGVPISVIHQHLNSIKSQTKARNWAIISSVINRQSKVVADTQY